ncbi:GlxA family transcriptional regulator [Oceanibium sediminis]|uniref:GlxA family transcriptional regulator n=1 Tax=Oceanibium sediminis TaxID=2026339 RepID=UPI001E323F37|nr:GlxA family transcriptional regulator [Oceanibium sediminis]
MDKGPQAAPPFRVGFYAVPGYALLSFACCVEPLRAANLLAGETLYEMVHLGPGGGSRSSQGALMEADAAIGALPPLDLLLVCAGGEPMLHDDPQAFRWLGQMARRGVRLGGISGGPVILARAGLMAGRRMTVHWEHAPALAEAYPDLLLERRLYVLDRDRVTCGGGTAPLDLMHALILSHHGTAFAQQVSDWFLHTDIRTASAPQRAGLVERLGTHARPVLEAVAAMEDHQADPLTLGQLADRTGISRRQLNRVFRAETGQSTMAYYRGLRLGTARRMLRATALPLTDIALATGFAGSAHFSAAYRAAFGEPPSAQRRPLGVRR